MTDDALAALIIATCRAHDDLAASAYTRPVGILTTPKTYRARYPPERQAAAIRRIQKRLGVPSTKGGQEKC